MIPLKKHIQKIMIKTIKLLDAKKAAPINSKTAFSLSRLFFKGTDKEAANNAKAAENLRKLFGI